MKRKEKWAKELDDLFCLRMNKIINETGHAWWATTIKELVTVQLFFDSLKKDFIDIDKEGEYVNKKQHDILQFDWLDDTIFDKWMVDISHGVELEDTKTDDDKEMEQNEVQIIDTSARDQRKEEDKGE